MGEKNWRRPSARDSYEVQLLKGYWQKTHTRVTTPVAGRFPPRHVTGQVPSSPFLLIFVIFINSFYT